MTNAQAPAPAAPAVKTLQLPAPNEPMVMRMITNNFFPAPPAEPGKRALQEAEREGVTWTLNQAHPLIPQMRIERMFVDARGGVEVYSVSGDGRMGMRHLIPQPWVRIVEEVMSLDIFVEELALAEERGLEPDDGDLEPEAPEEAAVSPATSNGQSAS